jgi:hypothetical protein
MAGRHNYPPAPFNPGARRVGSGSGSSLGPDNRRLLGAAGNLPPFHDATILDVSTLDGFGNIR